MPGECTNHDCIVAAGCERIFRENAVVITPEKRQEIATSVGMAIANAHNHPEVGRRSFCKQLERRDTLVRQARAFCSNFFPLAAY